MRLFKRLQKKIGYLSEDHVEQIKQAYLFAEEAHKDQKRQTGEPYITHPIAVAGILAEMHMDHQSILAAILHDVIEDTGVLKEVISEKFGETTAELVDGVTKLTKIERGSHAEAQAKNFRKMVLAMARDIRVILIKLADRLHNMRTLGTLPFEKQQRIAKETLEIYAPIANRLGMRNFRIEFEDLGFIALYPKRYKVLKDAVKKARGNRREILSIIGKTLKAALSRKDLPPSVLIGREKHMYGIYKKMREKRIPFSEIMDVFAFRIIVDNVDDCYRMLGVVHQVYKPLPERFKDYIAIPKINGYQSLHTTLFGPYGVPIEIQIRTHDMDGLAANGIAAHWLYKTGERLEGSQLRAQQWVNNLLEMQRKTGSPLEFIENVKFDLFPDEVYVFTPKGIIMELPRGATVIDFAYAVHTDVGNACVTARIDRHIAPLSASLSNGQTVEVITSPRARPNPAWLNFVVTGKARSSIRHYLKNQRSMELIDLGQRLLESSLQGFSLTLKRLSKGPMDHLLKSSNLESKEELYEQIGLGHQLPQLVARRLVQVYQELSKRKGKIPKEAEVVTPPLQIRGTEGMSVAFGKCCYPIPGDPVVGIFSEGAGIVIHRANCKVIEGLFAQPERCLPVTWANQETDEFAVSVCIDLANQRGVLAMLALAASDADANIQNIKIIEQDSFHYLVQLILSVHNRVHFANALRHIRAIRGVNRVWRDVLDQK